MYSLFAPTPTPCLLQYQEMANELHVYVFNLLAQREGKAHRTTRTSSVDFGSLAKVNPRVGLHRLLG